MGIMYVTMLVVGAAMIYNGIKIEDKAEHLFGCRGDPGVIDSFLGAAFHIFLVVFGFWMSYG